MAGTTKFDSDGMPIPMAAPKKDTPVLDKDGMPVPASKKKDAAGSPSPSDSLPMPSQTEPPVGTSVSDPKQVTANYKNNSLTPKDVGDRPMPVGPPLEQISSALNNKGKNLSTWSKSGSDGYVKGLVDRHQDAQNQINQININEKSRAIHEANNPGELAKLEESEKYFRGQIGKEYEARKQK